jgi:hypothetical protein
MAKTERKTAVVLIHGIGDQVPLATLRSFVAAVLGPPGPDARFPPFWSKPDAVSGSFDLRRFQSVGRNSGGIRRPPVDFYEYYWAHRMEGSAVSHALQWLEHLLLRRLGAVPRPLRKVWLLAWLALVGLAVAAIGWGSLWTVLTAGAVAAALVFVARQLATLVLRNWIGDAARYFSPRPQNIKVREDIRRGCVDLLARLHETGEYGRVIVVGHSLGSAIAVDALYHYWTLARERHGSPDLPANAAREQLEKALKSGKALGPQALRPLQKALWRELRANGVPWRITDLITLGSPLTYYPFLAGLGHGEFAERLAQREYSACPPVLDGEGIAYWSRYGKVGQQRSIAILHHAACFAATRWTNIYFPYRGLIAGDPVGGPLQGLFGSGIDDRPVRTRRWFGRLNHLHYWADDPRDAGAADRPLHVLLEAMALGEGFAAPRPLKAAAPPG